MIQTCPHFLSRKCIYLIHTSSSVKCEIFYQIRKLELLIKIFWEVFWWKMTCHQPWTQSKKLCNMSTKKYLILNKKYTEQILFHEKQFWQKMFSSLCVGKWLSCYNSHLLPTASSAACSHGSLLLPHSEHRMQREGHRGQESSTRFFLLGRGLNLPWQLYCFRKQKGGSKA